MDRQLRELERAWNADGDPQRLEALLTTMLRMDSLEEWEIAAEQGHDLALRNILFLRDFVREDLQNSEVFANVYEDFTARSAIRCAPQNLTNVRRWLREYYTGNQLFYQGRTVHTQSDDGFWEDVEDPPAKVIIENSSAPCLRMYPSEIFELAEQQGQFLPMVAGEFDPAVLRRLSPINRWGQRERYVGFVIVDSLDVPASESEEQTGWSDCWINVYEVSRNYGGSHEGGWYYNLDDPISSLYVGPLATSTAAGGRLLTRINRIGGQYHVASNQTEVPSHLQPAVDYLATLYQDVAWGDIYSSTGGRDLAIRLETHPAMRDPIQAPHYE